MRPTWPVWCVVCVVSVRLVPLYDDVGFFVGGGIGWCGLLRCVLFMWSCCCVVVVVVVLCVVCCVECCVVCCVGRVGCWLLSVSVVVWGVESVCVCV